MITTAACAEPDTIIGMLRAPAGSGRVAAGWSAGEDDLAEDAARDHCGEPGAGFGQRQGAIDVLGALDAKRYFECGEAMAMA